MRLTYTTELTTETIRRRPALSAKEFVENGLGQDYEMKQIGMMKLRLIFHFANDII